MTVFLALPFFLLSTQVEKLELLVADALWSPDSNTREAAIRALESDASLRSVSREDFQALERVLDRGRPSYPPLPEKERLYLLEVPFPDGRRMPAFVLAAPEYQPSKAWPLLLAMHGGPTASAEQALQGAQRMLAVWLESATAHGLIVVSPEG